MVQLLTNMQLCVYLEIIQHVCILGFLKSFGSVSSGGFNTCQFFLVCERILLRARKTAVTMKYGITVIQQLKSLHSMSVLCGEAHLPSF